LNIFHNILLILLSLPPLLPRSLFHYILFLLYN
jgi:hypothetical protein